MKTTIYEIEQLCKKHNFSKNQTDKVFFYFLKKDGKTKTKIAKFTNRSYAIIFTWDKKYSHLTVTEFLNKLKTSRDRKVFKLKIVLTDEEINYINKLITDKKSTKTSITKAKLLLLLNDNLKIKDCQKKIKCPASTISKLKQDFNKKRLLVFKQKRTENKYKNFKPTVDKKSLQLLKNIQKDAAKPVDEIRFAKILFNLYTGKDIIQECKKNNLTFTKLKKLDSKFRSTKKIICGRTHQKAITPELQKKLIDISNSKSKKAKIAKILIEVYDGKSLQTIAKKIGVTREYIRQLVLNYKYLSAKTTIELLSK